MWTLRSAALSACCACAAGAKFEFAAEAQALTHHYIKSSGLEDLSYFSFISLAIVVLGGAALSVLLSLLLVFDAVRIASSACSAAARRGCACQYSSCSVYFRSHRESDDDS